MVNYRLATEDDYQDINNFYNRIYQKNRTMLQFLWEFHNCPYGKSIYVIATDEGKIVGTNCVIPIMLTNSNNELTLTGKSEDTLVDPDYRGQNIFNNIYDFLYKECANKGIKIIWGYTSAKKPFQKIGFQVPFEHQQSLIVNNIIKSYKYLVTLNQNNKVIQKCQILALCILSKLRSYKGYFTFSKSGFKIVEDQNVTDQVSNLIKSNCENSPNLFYILQSKEFQQWRIYDNPNYYKLHTYAAYNSSDKLMALITLNSHIDGVAYIIQTSFNASIDQKERVIILKQVIKSLFEQGISLIRNWHFNTNPINSDEIEVFKNANFIVLKKGIGFVWKEIETTKLNPNNFLLSRISTQGVI